MPLTKVPLDSGVTNTLPVANGGTGATTQAGAAANVLPTQTGNSGKYLTTDGTNTSWATVTIPASPIPTGSVFLLYQASAPTGWTQVTTLNDYALRIVSGTGGTTGGTTAFSTVFANQTPTINVSGLSAGATTLSTTQMPSHTHDLNGSTNPTGGGTGQNFSTVGSIPDYSPFFDRNWTTQSQGGGGSHSHSISGSATSSAITLNVRYANIILCSKN